MVWHVGGIDWAAVAADVDADGQVELVTIDDSFALGVWNSDPDGWNVTPLGASSSTLDRATDSRITLDRARERPRHMAVADLNGNGLNDVLAETGWVAGNQIGRPPMLRVLANDGTLLQQFMGESHWALVHRTAGEGPTFIGAGARGSVVTVPPGPGPLPVC